LEKTRGSWLQLVGWAIGLLIGLFAISYLARQGFQGTGLVSIYSRAVIRFAYAAVVVGVGLRLLNGQRILVSPIKMTRFLQIMLGVIIALLVLLLLAGGFPYRLIGMVKSPFFIANTLVALSAGMLEEMTCRGLLFSGFAMRFRHFRYRWTLAAVTSGMVFGLLHFTNMIAGQGLQVTAQQACYAVILGILFVTIRLATNSLVWIIGIHFLIDWQPTISTSVLSGQGSPWGPFLILWLPVLAVGLLFMWGYDRQFNRIKSNALL
jgi:membrane protease YdiL (CAAX protease family)